MSKHPYDVVCECARCLRERARRAKQSERDRLNADHVRFYQQPVRRRRAGARRPIVGSQEWAETRGDDIDSGPDY